LPSISTPLSFHKADPEELLQLLARQGETRQKSSNSKLGRKGISKSFKRMAEAVHLRKKPEVIDDDDEVVERRDKPKDLLSVKTRAANRRSLNREPSRRSQHLAKFLRKRPTQEDLIAQGILKDSSVFGCHLHYQKLQKDQSLQVPEFIWRCLTKLESDPTFLSTTGIYRVPGDAARIQKIRLDVDQGRWDSFEACDDVHVLAGSLKLFLRELPDPLIPYKVHSDAVRAAMGLGVAGEDIAQSLDIVLDQLEEIERDTLEVLAHHLGKVARANNKMDIDNLGLLFGQVLLWPDPGAPLDMKLIAEAAKNCQVADALIRHHAAIFPPRNSLAVPTV